MTTDSCGTISRGFGAVTGISRKDPGLVSSLRIRENIKRYIFTPSTFSVRESGGSPRVFRIRIRVNQHGVHSFKINYASQNCRVYWREIFHSYGVQPYTRIVKLLLTLVVFWKSTLNFLSFASGLKYHNTRYVAKGV